MTLCDFVLSKAEIRFFLLQPDTGGFLRSFHLTGGPSLVCYCGFIVDVGDRIFESF
jgi:hypothetical protein